MTDVQDFKLTKEEKLIMDQQYLKIKLPVENTVDEQSVSMSQQATLWGMNFAGESFNKNSQQSFLINSSTTKLKATNRNNRMFAKFTVKRHHRNSVAPKSCKA